MQYTKLISVVCTYAFNFGEFSSIQEKKERKKERKKMVASLLKIFQNITSKYYE